MLWLSFAKVFGAFTTKMGAIRLKNKRQANQDQNWSPHFPFLQLKLWLDWSLGSAGTNSRPPQRRMDTRGCCHTCRTLFSNNLSFKLKLLVNNHKQLQSVEHIGAVVPVAGQITLQLPGLKPRQGETASLFRNDVSGVKASPASDFLAVTDCGCMASGWEVGAGLQVVQRSYFIVPSLNRPKEENLWRNRSQDTAAVQRRSCGCRRKIDKNSFMCFSPRVVLSRPTLFFFSSFFLSTRISRWVTAPTTFSVTRHVHIFKKENHTVAHSI